VKVSFLIYLAIVSGTLFFLWLILDQIMKRVEKKKTKLLEKRRSFESLATEGPTEENHEEALSRGLDNIETRFMFFRRFLAPAMIGLWLLIMALPYLDTASKTYTSIILTVITVFFSLAAKPFVENLFAGMVISFSNSARIGDTVEIDGHYGTVEEINFTFTTIKVWDWRRYLVPNAKLITKEFLNYSLHDKHLWACVEFFIEPDADMKKVESILVTKTKASKYFNQKQYEEPKVWNMGIEKECIKIWLAAWAKNPSDAWELRSDMRNAIFRNS
jgi:small-conductance mechanosensitive channel